LNTAILRQGAQYVVVGLISTAINYLIFIGAIAAGLHYLLAATISSLVTLVVGYFLHRTFTFSVPGRANLKEFASFVGVFAVQYALAMGGYTLLIGYLGLGPSLAFLINAVFIAAVAFVLLRNVTFRGRFSPDSAPSLSEQSRS
jgi:putative flippase GtrA